MARRRLAVVSAALGFCVAAGGAASAMPIAFGHSVRIDATRTVRVGDTAEAWFSTPSGSVCLPIIGCLPLPLPVPSTYPAGTLHVGVTLGKESARTYVVPDLAGPTGDRQATDGQLRLPVDSDPLAGGLDVGSARLRACLTTGRLPASASAKAMATGTPPSIDCNVAAAVSYDSAGRYYYVELARFIAKWNHGAPNRGVAIVPSLKGSSPLANWQVAIDGKGGPAPQVFSLVSFAAVGEPGRTASPSPAGTAQVIPPAPVTPPLPGVGEVAPDNPAPTIAPPAQSAVYFVRSTKFRYPAIFIAPLAILAGVMFFSRLFTGSSVRPRRRMTLHHDE